MPATLPSLAQMLTDFHAKNPPAAPGAPSTRNLTPALTELRRSLLDSEVAELHEAVESGDLTGILKEACDVIFVVAGTALALGLPLDEGLLLVYLSNMSKTPAADGAGKAVKGDGYQPAEPLLAALIRHRISYPGATRALAGRDERRAQLRAAISTTLGDNADSRTVNALMALVEAETVTLEQQVTGLKSLLDEHEAAILWGTACWSCTILLDLNYEDNMRAEQAERRAAAAECTLAGKLRLDDDDLGRAVREEWIGAVLEHIPHPKRSWTESWAETDDFQRLADRRIGRRLAAIGWTLAMQQIRAGGRPDDLAGS
jgi:hypothetical protein